MPGNHCGAFVARALLIALIAIGPTLAGTGSCGMPSATGPATANTAAPSAAAKGGATEAASSAAASCADNAYPLRLTTGSRLLVSARVNGNEVEALLDSGAEASLLDTEFAQRIGLTGGKDVTARGSGAGTTKASLVSGVTLEAFGLKLTDRTVGVVPLTDVGQRLLGHPLPFILGREIFDGARLQIDIEGKTVRVVDRTNEPHGVRLPLQSSHGIETLPVLIEGRPAQALFDLGNGSSPMLGGAFVDAARMLTDGRKVSEVMGGGIGGEVARQQIILKSLEMAGKQFENVLASIDRGEHAHEFNVGVSLLRHYYITTDFAQRAVWLQPRGD